MVFASRLKNVAQSLENSVPLLEIEGLTKSFGGLIAVKNVGFDINKGEIVGLIGPNGSGKTTLFNLITGFIKADTGKVKFKGEDITGLSPHRIARKGIGRTFQIPQLFSNMTVYQTVLVGVLFGRKRKENTAERVNAVLKLVGLSDKADMLCGQLSGPDKKRVELARALTQHPTLLLLDEVLAGLNPSEIEQAIKLIKHLRELGITILMVEHIIGAIMQVSDRVIVLNYGEKIAEGAPSEVVKAEQVIRAYLGAAYA